MTGDGNPELPNSDSQARIIISPDQMTAHLSWKPQNGLPPLDQASLVNLLAAHGLNPPDVSEVFRQLDFFQDREISLKVAEGKAPTNGQDAQIIYRFRTGKACPRPTELADGRMDYYNLNTIQIAQEGELLAEKIPPTTGEPGLTVTGKEIPPKAGRDITIKVGSNTILSEDGLTLTAGLTGQVVLQNEKVSVLPIYEVKGDIDFSIGNIDFPGSVVITGNVKGFQVKASGNIEIGGVVSLGSNIIAGHDVTVRGGILSEVTAGGKVTALFAEHATVKAGDSVYINDAVMYGAITAGQNIEVSGRGLLVGGTYCAGGDIIAKTIGSHLATPTKLCAGVSIELQNQYHETIVNLRKKEETADAIQKNIKVIKDLLLKGSALTPERKEKFTELLTTLKTLQEEIPELRSKEMELQLLISQKTRGKIEAKEIIYPGVDVFIGNNFMKTLDEYHRATLEVENAEIVVR